MEHVLEILEIAHLLARPVTKLSGGEAQRVALARAILSRPQLLLLDEPLAALDIGLKEKILPYLARVRDEFAIPMIYVTHNVTEVLTLADWVLVIRSGRLLAQGAPKETLTSSRAVREIPEEELENVFTVTFIESDKAAGRSRVRLSSGAEIFVPYLAQRRSPDVSDSRQRGRYPRRHPTPRRNIGGKYPAGHGSRHRHDRRSSIGAASMPVKIFCVRLTAGAVTRLALDVGCPVFLIIKTRSFRLL